MPFSNVYLITGIKNNMKNHPMKMRDKKVARSTVNRRLPISSLHTMWMLSTRHCKSSAAREKIGYKSG
jgi:hypothetical protein